MVQPWEYPSTLDVGVTSQSYSGRATVVVVVSGTVVVVVDVVEAGGSVVTGATVVDVTVVLAGALSAGVHATASRAAAIATTEVRDMDLEHTVGHMLLASVTPIFGGERRRNGVR
jgi:hypothetical protein